MQNFNLTPFSHWCLLGGFILLIIFLIITAVKAVPLVKAISHTKKAYLDHIQEGVTATKIKTDVIKEKKQKAEKTVKPLLSLVPLLIAMVKNYRNDDEKKGPKGMRKAADEEILRRYDKEKVQSFLKNFI